MSPSSLRPRVAVVGALTALVAPAAVVATAGAPGPAAAAPSAAAQSQAATAPVGQAARKNRARPWEDYVLAPSTRTLRAEGVHASVDVDDPQGAYGEGAMVIGEDGQVTLDFGLNVGGTLSLEFGEVAGDDPRVGIAFSETAKYVGRESEASTGGPRGRDGTIWVDATTSGGSWTAPPELLRGAFRYVTLFVVGDQSVEVDDVVLDFTAAPLMEDPSDYPNYFYSSSQLLNRLWYSGAYTTQLTTITPTSGRSWPAPDALWDNSATSGVGDSILVDGAKRDRTVWPGDLGVSQGTAFVSTGDTTSVRNSIMTAYEHQRATGELPYAAPELDFWRSDTYHMWTLLATAENFENTADRAWLRRVWPRYVAGVEFIRAKVGDRGLLFIDETNDTTHESRIADGEEAMANVMYWRLMRTGADLATELGHRGLARDMRTQARTVARAIDTHLWDDEVGALRWYPEDEAGGSPDDSGTYPQSANSLAVWWDLLDPARADRAMAALRERNWVERGARTPERDDDLQLLFGSFELQAQLGAGDTEAQEAAVDLMRRQWGWMLRSAQGPQSTFWESLRESGEIVSSYQSYAHGWSTGPTRALTEQVLGIQQADGGATWRLDPHPAGLRSAQGRLVTGRGPVDARWTDTAKRFRLVFTTPRRSQGLVELPVARKRAVVRLDGKVVWRGGKRVARAGHPVRWDGERLVIRKVRGGKHTATVR